MAVVFDENGHASVAGTIRVFHYVSDTGEYRGWSDEYIPVGVSLPGSSTTIDPGDEITKHIWVFDGGMWSSLEDHRGETVFSTDDGAPSVVKYIGAIHAGFTIVAPATPYDKWDGTQWVTDSDAQHSADVSAAVQKKNILRTVADEDIAWLQDAVDADIATDGEAALLASWKNYRVLLMRVDVTKAPDIEWPTPPVE